MQTPHLLSRALRAAAPLVSSNPRFAGIFAASLGGYNLWGTDDFAEFSRKNTEFAEGGLRLVSVSSIVDFGRPWYYGVWTPGQGSHDLLRTSDWNELNQAFQSRAGRLKLTDVNVTVVDGVVWYIGAWVESTTKQILLNDLNSEALGAQWSDLSTNQAMRLTKLQSYPLQNQPRFVALFEAGSGGYVLLGTSFDNLLSAYFKYSGSLELTSFSLEAVSGAFMGVWRRRTAPQYFAHSLDWDAFTVRAGQLSQQGLQLRAITAYPSAPQWHDYFERNVKPYVRGYAWAVAKDGQVISEGAGLARGPNERINPNLPMTADSRINIASVSKPIAGIAMQVLMAQKGISVDAAFYPFIARRVLKPDPSILPVTLRNLLTMKAGMGDGNNVRGDLWTYINGILSKPLVGTPGKTYVYSNGNFTILEGVIEELTGLKYADYVTRSVLASMGIDPSIFSVNPDPPSTATLCYSGPNDTLPGQYWGKPDVYAAGGWVSSVRELIKVMIGLRNNVVMPASTASAMFSDELGWYTGTSAFGDYYQHNGGLLNGLKPPQQLNTGMIRFPEGYDAVLVANCLPPNGDVIYLMVNAFRARGFGAGRPSSVPVVYSATNAASMLPVAAPGALLAIVGEAFGAETRTWSDAIPDGKALPVSLNGISVRVDAKACYLNYVSDTGLNVLLPSTLRNGVLTVEVTTAQGIATFTVPVRPVAPGLFSYPLQGLFYAVALFSDSSVYVAQPGAIAGYDSRPAMGGDSLQIYGTGLGLTRPAFPDGQALDRVYPIDDLSRVSVTVGGQNAAVQFAGLVEPGIFQVNIRMPAGVPGGNAPLVLSIDGVPSQNNLMLAVQA